MAGPPPVPGGGRSDEERERARIEREARRRDRESTGSTPAVKPSTAGGRRGFFGGGGGDGRAKPLDQEAMSPFDDDTFAPDVDDDTFAFDTPAPRPTRKEVRAARKKEEQRQQLRERAASSSSHKRVNELRAARQARMPGSSVSRRRVFVILAGIAVLLVAWFLISLFQPFTGDGGKPHRVTIKSKSGLDGIASTLEDQHIIGSQFFFKLRATLSGHRGDLKPGTYTLREGMSYEKILDTLSKGIVVKTINLTLPEGKSRVELDKSVAESGLDGDYDKATVKSSILDPKDYGAKHARNLEGFLFPATYTLKSGASVDDLVAKQLTTFKQRFATVSMRRAKAKNLTKYDVLIIASLVERETASPHERRLIASVIYNRLKNGTPLGIDATTRFEKQNWTRPLKNSDFTSKSGYNTRTHTGLPPGPIGNPGLASIRAAANPANTHYLFYVVNPCKPTTHKFTRTLEEFNAAVARYNDARAKAGGKAPKHC